MLWTCREGFERDLRDELSSIKKNSEPQVLQPALVISGPVAKNVAPVFARQGFLVQRELPADPEICARFIKTLIPPGKDWSLHVWVPDSEDGNRLSQDAALLREGILGALEDAREREMPATEFRSKLNRIVQVCMYAPNKVAIGAHPAGETVSMWPGGRARMKVPGSAPSRAAMKLAEAFSWLGHGPEGSDVCVDLGAAPGGWTWLLLKRGAHVVAVDLGNMAPELRRQRKLQTIKGNAFSFEPDETVDWLFCDMVWRPLEVASMLAKWARHKKARFLVANIKLPMHHKAKFLNRIRGILEKGGWKELQMRHLYHDRDEVTVTARR